MLAALSWPGLIAGSGNLLVLCGIDQLPESRSMVLSEICAGDFSAGCTGWPFMLAVSVEMDGRVWDEETWGFCWPSQGRCETEFSIVVILVVVSVWWW